MRRLILHFVVRASMTRTNSREEIEQKTRQDFNREFSQPPKAISKQNFWLQNWSWKGHFVLRKSFTEILSCECDAWVGQISIFQITSCESFWKQNFHHFMLLDVKRHFSLSSLANIMCKFFSLRRRVEVWRERKLDSSSDVFIWEPFHLPLKLQTWKSHERGKQ